MTLKELRCYRIICAEIIRLEERLENDKYHVTDAVQSASEFPYWKHTVQIEGDQYPYPVDHELRKIRNLKERKGEIEKFVSAVPDYKIRRCMEICFIEPCDTRITWEMVADAINDGSTGDGLRMAVKRYLKQ